MSEETKKMQRNPYLEARRLWDERYGDSIARARTWRIAAMASLAVAAVAVAGVAYIGAQSKIKPFVVALDTLGNPVAMAQPSDGSAVPQRIIESEVANFIWNARTQLADAQAQQALLSRVYAMVSTDAASYLNDYYRAHSPFGSGMTTKVEIMSVLPDSKDSYQVRWKESRYNGSQPVGADYWMAHITTGVDAKLAEKPEVMLSNPLGVYVSALSWTQTLSN